MKQENKFCCVGMESKINNVKKKGFSIIHEDNCAYLVFNTIDVDKEEVLTNVFREKLIGLKIPSIGLNGRVQINFCPYCGKKIELR